MNCVWAPCANSNITCRYWATSGTCFFGDQCNFAHNAADRAASGKSGVHIYLYSSVLLVAKLSSCVLGPAHTSNSHICTTLEGFPPLSHSALISSKFVDVGQFYSGVSCVWLWADL
jgi:hypothetical protein